VSTFIIYEGFTVQRACQKKWYCAGVWKFTVGFSQS